jgi:hypothetical protein
MFSQTADGRTVCFPNSFFLRKNKGSLSEIVRTLSGAFSVRRACTNNLLRMLISFAHVAGAYLPAAVSIKAPRWGGPKRFWYRGFEARPRRSLWPALPGLSRHQRPSKLVTFCRVFSLDIVTFCHADRALYLSKSAGRNRVTQDAA